MVPKASVSVITGHETVNVSLPDGSTSQGHILAVPMLGSGVRQSVPKHKSCGAGQDVGVKVGNGTGWD